MYSALITSDTKHADTHTKSEKSIVNVEWIIIRHGFGQWIQLTRTRNAKTEDSTEDEFLLPKRFLTGTTELSLLFALSLRKLPTSKETTIINNKNSVSPAQTKTNWENHADLKLISWNFLSEKRKGKEINVREMRMQILFLDWAWAINKIDMSRTHARTTKWRKKNQNRKKGARNQVEIYLLVVRAPAVDQRKCIFNIAIG